MADLTHPLEVMVATARGYVAASLGHLAHQHPYAAADPTHQAAIEAFGDGMAYFGPDRSLNRAGIPNRVAFYTGFIAGHEGSARCPYSIYEPAHAASLAAFLSGLKAYAAARSSAEALIEHQTGRPAYGRQHFETLSDTVHRVARQRNEERRHGC